MRILFIDTCTWLKLEILDHKDLFKTSTLFAFSPIAITHEIKKELEYYSVSHVDFEKIVVYPIGDQEMFRHALDLGFDEADASLLSNGKIVVDDIFLVSEDRAILAFGQLYEMNLIQLIDLFRILTALDYMEKTNFYNLIKFLRTQRNITKKKKKDLLEWYKTYK